MSDINNILNKDADRVLTNVDISSICNKKILIAGASGLIGTHLVYSIKRFAETVKSQVELSIIIRGDLPAHLKFADKYDWITVYRGDMTNEEFLHSLPCFDIIIDAAGYGQPLRFMNESVNTLKINTYTVFELMDHLKKGGKFLFMSSSAVYTGCSELPFSEDLIGNSNTNHPRSCYIEGKKCGEAICNAYRLDGIDAKSVRLSIIYGPGTKKDDVRVMNTFIRSALTNHKIKLFDKGTAIKAFMYVSDAVEIIWKIILLGQEATYNIGGQEQISILELAKIIGKYCNVPVECSKNNNSEVKGAIVSELLDMKKVEQEFKKSDYIKISDGVCQTIDWARLNLYNDN